MRICCIGQNVDYFLYCVLELNVVGQFHLGMLFTLFIRLEYNKFLCMFLKHCSIPNKHRFSVSSVMKT